MSLESLAKQAAVSDKIAILKDRGQMLAASRAFFMERGVVEVDTPLISEFAAVDAHIDLISARYINKETRYLHSSPEYGMKRLIAEGIGDIYQLSHVFRDGECGRKHNPEFMMAEWYRLGFTFEQMIEETLDYIRLFVGPLPSSTVSYREAFQRWAGFDYLTMSPEDLFEYIVDNEVPHHPEDFSEGKDNLLNLILAHCIEPRLGNNELTVLSYYPASQAALSKKICRNDEPVCERFEVYYKGVELANGYHELTDAAEQAKRFKDSNEMRVALGKATLPPDLRFLDALRKGLPDCCGVAVGFDRLMMLRHDKNHIENVIPFDWANA